MEFKSAKRAFIADVKRLLFFVQAALKAAFQRGQGSTLQAGFRGCIYFENLRLKKIEKNFKKGVDRMKNR